MVLIDPVKVTDVIPEVSLNVIINCTGPCTIHCKKNRIDVETPITFEPSEVKVYVSLVSEKF